MSSYPLLSLHIRAHCIFVVLMHRCGGVTSTNSMVRWQGEGSIEGRWGSSAFTFLPAPLCLCGLTVAWDRVLGSAGAELHTVLLPQLSFCGAVV